MNSLFFDWRHKFFLRSSQFKSDFFANGERTQSKNSKTRFGYIAKVCLCVCAPRVIPTHLLCVKIYFLVLNSFCFDSMANDEDKECPNRLASFRLSFFSLQISLTLQFVFMVFQCDFYLVCICVQHTHNFMDVDLSELLHVMLGEFVTLSLSVSVCCACVCGFYFDFRCLFSSNLMILK